MKKPDAKNPEWVKAAKAFAEAFRKSAAAQTPVTSFSPNSGTSMGAAGVVEITDNVQNALVDLRTRTVRLLGSKAGHEQAISQMLYKQAHQSLSEGQTLDEMAGKLIEVVLNQALVNYKYVAPNRLFRFAKGVRSITFGNVRVMLISDLQIERESEFPDSKLKLIPGKEFSFVPGPSISITMHPICWVVSVDAIAENVEEEGKWLIDVAVSLLRLSYNSWANHPPATGACEPHPIDSANWKSETLKINGSTLLAGAATVPPWYEISAEVEAMVSTQDFQAKASAIFSPNTKSVAVRIAQGLGWLTRGRQSADRAERLLYFFTAIESLLSGTDKGAPVVQTIARHAGVMLSNDNEERLAHAANLKALYNLRSSLVHNGVREVNWTAANEAQIYAEELFIRALEFVPLTMKHEEFCAQLSAASYGLVWPPL